MSKFDKDQFVEAPFDTEGLPEGAETGDEIEPMFDIVLADVDDRSNFGEMMHDIYDWWQEKGFLAKQQYTTLKNAYERHGERF